ncbi:hypothetical protein VTH06DRAFT_847 [Thermothelomyces fergusii]
MPLLFSISNIHGAFLDIASYGAMAPMQIAISSIARQTRPVSGQRLKHYKIAHKKAKVQHAIAPEAR